MEFEKSTLTIVKEFSFCPICMEDTTHKASCVNVLLGKNAFVTT